MVFFLIIVSPTARHNYIVSKIGDVNQYMYNRDLGSFTKTRTTIVIHRCYMQILRYMKYCLLNLTNSYEVRKIC